jgi:hypothetical protein
VTVTKDVGKFEAKLWQKLAKTILKINYSKTKYGKTQTHAN